LYIAADNGEENGKKGRGGPPEGYIPNMILSFVGVILNTLAFWFGYQLWQNPYFAAISSANEVTIDIVHISDHASDMLLCQRWRMLSSICMEWTLIFIMR